MTTIGLSVARILCNARAGGIPSTMQGYGADAAVVEKRWAPPSPSFPLLPLLFPVSLCPDQHASSAYSLSPTPAFRRRVGITSDTLGL